MPDVAGKKNKILIYLRIAVVLGCVVYLISWAFGTDEQTGQAGWRIFTQINPLILATALIIYCVGQCIVGLRWWLLLRTQNIKINLFAAIRLIFLGLFYNNVMPGSVGGDLLRAYYVTKHTEKKLESVLSVFVDRVVGLTSTLVIAAFFYVIFVSNRGKSLEFEAGSSILQAVIQHKTTIFAIILIIFAPFLIAMCNKRGRNILLKLYNRVRQAGEKMAKKVIKSVTIYCSKPLSLLGVFVLTVCMQISTITGFWLIGRNLGIDANIEYYYVIFTLTWVLGAIPVSVGGVGVVEGMIVLLFSVLAGVNDPGSKDLVLALAMCQRFVWLLASLPGAAIHFKGTHLPKDFFVDYQQNID